MIMKAWGVLPCLSPSLSPSLSAHLGRPQGPALPALLTRPAINPGP